MYLRAMATPHWPYLAALTYAEHACHRRSFPILAIFYDPSRQSRWPPVDVEAMALTADDIQSPDWVRSYPAGNAGDALAYTKKGFLFQEAVGGRPSTKIYGESVETRLSHGARHPTWSQF